MIEKYLVVNCAPTLASLKTANLVNVPYESFDELKKCVEEWNSELSCKGVHLTILKRCSNFVLLYVYRLNMLRRDLSDEKAVALLKYYGYESTDCNYCIARLKKRLSECDSFPHEIGLFLGYPVEDVIGFIKNSGKNCKCIGCWKVYCNECEAIKTFCRFKKCTKIYCKLWQQGRSVSCLTVAA